MYLTDIPFIADFMNNSYTFDLDAACVYYFSVGSDVAYAGDQNFTSMTFGANLDDDTVGAEGTVAERGQTAGNRERSAPPVLGARSVVFMG